MVRAVATQHRLVWWSVGSVGCGFGGLHAEPLQACLRVVSSMIVCMLSDRTSGHCRQCFAWTGLGSVSMLCSCKGNCLARPCMSASVRMGLGGSMPLCVHLPTFRAVAGLL